MSTAIPPKCYGCGQPINDTQYLSWNGRDYHVDHMPTARPEAKIDANWPKAFGARRARDSWHAEVSFTRRPTDEEIESLGNFLNTTFKSPAA